MTRRPPLLLVLAAVTLALAVPAAEAQPEGGVVHAGDAQSKPLLELGEQLYAGNCSRCHGTEGGGLESLGPPLEGVGALAADFYLDTGYMPLGDPQEQPRRSRVEFSQRELDALVAYVASLGAGPEILQPQPERGNVAEGLQLFTEHCAGCHQVVGEGGYLTNAVAPPLHEATPVQVAEAVRIGPYYMPRYSERAISDAELDSIVAYVEASKAPKDEGGWGIGHVGPVPEGLVAWLVAGAALVGVCVLVGGRIRR